MLLFLLSVFGCSSKDPADGETESNETEDTEQTAATVEAFGIAEATSTVSLSLDFPVKIAAVLVRAGERVTKNTPLVELDLSQFRRTLSDTEHRLDTERLRLRELQAQNNRLDDTRQKELSTLTNNLKIEQTELILAKERKRKQQELVELGNDPSLNKLESDLLVSQSLLESKRNSYEEQTSLFRDGIVAEKVIEEQRLTIDRNQAELSGIQFLIERRKLELQRELEGMQIEISRKQTTIENIDTELRHLSTPETTAIEIQRSLILQLELELARFFRQLEKPHLSGTSIVSPLDNAVLSEMSHIVGEGLAAENRIVLLVDLDSLIVKADVSEEFIKDISLGDSATIVPLADRGRNIPGTVTGISAIALNQAGETIVPVYLKPDDPEGFLLPGFNVDISFDSDHIE